MTNDAILEIRAAAGGLEAELFASELMRMYRRYADRHSLGLEVLDHQPTSLGGLKNATLLIKGQGAFERLRGEAGVHRVQRVPKTEKSGRIHTSTVSVACLPVVEEQAFNLKPQDLRIETFRSSGHGGQSVNTTDSAVRITHLPTGLTVSMQDERSQLKNKERALKVLRAKLAERTERERNATTGAARRTQIGTGDRSEKIRTYNFPQDRVTDHRAKVTLRKIDRVLDGDLDPILRRLRPQIDIHS